MLIFQYFYEFTPTESSAGGIADQTYIADHLAYQKKNDLNIYEKNYLESTFIEINNLSKTNIIVGCIYRHQLMDFNELNCYYLNPLLEKLAKEQKNVLLLGVFNVDLLKYEQREANNEFRDSLSSNMVLPYINQQTRITSHSKSFIHNAPSNYISQDSVSANLTATISNHIPQILIAPHIFSNALNKKYNFFEADSSKFSHEEFILDYFAIDCTHILKLQNNNTNTSFQNFFDSMSKILNKHAH